MIFRCPCRHWPDGWQGQSAMGLEKAHNYVFIDEFDVAFVEDLASATARSRLSLAEASDSDEPFSYIQSGYVFVIPKICYHRAWNQSFSFTMSACTQRGKIDF
jgi:hypothetical protein